MKYGNRFIIVIICTIAVLSFGSLFFNGIVKQEIVQCNYLLAQASDFGGFYLTQDEKDMCDSHHIDIDAPVYNPNDCVNGVSEDTPRCLIPESYFK